MDQELAIGLRDQHTIGHAVIRRRSATGYAHAKQGILSTPHYAVLMPF